MLTRGVVPAMPGSDEQKVASGVLNVLMEHQRLIKGATCPDCPCGRCLAVHAARAARYIARGEPVEFVLPAFPGKSPNPSKVLGPHADMAERLSLTFLKHLCDRIRQVYAPGARIIICSDGRVFTDVVQFTDADVTLYQKGVKEIINEIPDAPLELYDLDREFSGCSYPEMRRLLTERYGEDLEELRGKVRADEDLVTLYRGLTRFLYEDADTPGRTKSRYALQKDARRRAYHLLMRSRAWGRLVADRFPDAVRLSIHPQPCSSSKLGLYLMPGEQHSWMTPWHAAAVDLGDKFVLMKRSQAEAMEAELVLVDGKPSHFRAPEKDVVITRQRESSEVLIG